MPAIDRPFSDRVSGVASGLDGVQGLTRGIRLIDELSISMARAGQRRIVDGALQVRLCIHAGD